MKQVFHVRMEGVVCSMGPVVMYVSVCPSAHWSIANTAVISMLSMDKSRLWKYIMVYPILTWMFTWRMVPMVMDGL